eukprot:Skav219792  [mRNA]  locus=scaffold147:51762:53580:- [translate_table: standard]
MGIFSMFTARFISTTKAANGNLHLSKRSSTAGSLENIRARLRGMNTIRTASTAKTATAMAVPTKAARFASRVLPLPRATFSCTPTAVAKAPRKVKAIQQMR